MNTFKKQNLKINNKKAKFNFEFIDKYIVGIILQGSEIKSIRNYNVNFNDSYCYIKNKEVFIKNLHISEFKQASINNHDPLRDRKLLLTKREIKKLKKGISEKGLTIIPVNLFINDKGLCKLTIALSKSKKTYDKKNKIKESDIEKDKNKQVKDFNIY